MGEDFDETKEAKANKAVIEGKLAGMVHDENMQELIVKETSTETTARTKATEFATLVNDSTTALYPRCETEHTWRSIMTNLLDIKVKSNSIDTSLAMNLKYLHDVLPDGNILPKSIDEARKLLRPLYMAAEKEAPSAMFCWLPQVIYAS